MKDKQQLSHLIGLIYDAALVPDQWQTALSAVCDYVGGAGAMIFEHDSVFLEGIRILSWGDDPHYTHLYFSEYIDISPIAKLQGSIPIGEVVSFSGLVGKETLLGSRFFLEWMKPQNYTDNVFVNLHHSATRMVVFAVARGIQDGWVSSDTMARMQNLVSHVKRAVHIGNLIDRSRSQSATLQKLVDAVSASIFLVDQTGAISRANGLGETSAQDCELVWTLPNGRYRMDKRLEAELAAFSSQIVGKDALKDRRRSFTLGGSDGAEWLIHLHWLGREAGGAATDVTTPLVAIYLQRAAFNAEPALALVAHRYRLTPRESDVVRSLVGAGNIAIVAGQMGITTSTARTHMHHVFAKTGTASQAELVKLLASFVPPL